MRNADMAAAPIIGGSARDLVDFYWLGVVDLQNVLEDVEGADGRPAYLETLRLRLIELLQQMDGLLTGPAAQRQEGHRLAYALQHGIAFLGWNAETLRARLLLDGAMPGYATLQECLVTRIRAVVHGIPGDVPEAQGSQAQRHMLRAMRDWSALADAAGTDIAFLADRFRQL